MLAMARKPSWSRKIVILSLALNVFLIFVFGYVVFREGGSSYLINFFKSSLIQNKGTDLSAKNSKAMPPPGPFYDHRKSIFESLPDDENEIIFLGDSFVDFAEWSELFNNAKIKNRGIAGDRTDGVLQRLEEVLSSSPAKIFMMIGYNDLSKGRKIPEIVKNIKEILDSIKTNSPKTEIYIQSVLPLDKSIYKGNVDNRDIINLNDQLARLCELNGVVYIDLFSAFCDANNQLMKEFASSDGLHLNGKAYLKWKSILEKYIYP